MKKLAIVALVPCAMLISACSNMMMPNSNDYSGWNDFNFNNATVNSILMPNQWGYQQAAPADYQTPRQYYVTQQDEQDYNAINNRVQQRQQQLQQNSTSNATGSSTSVSTTTMSPTTSTTPGQQGSTY